MHVLFLPKWYPGRADPQLGDFLRKQALAAATMVRMSVLHVEPMTEPGAGDMLTLNTADGAWELHLRYKASSIRFMPARKLVNLFRYWRTMRNGWDQTVKERGLPDLIHAYILVRPVLFAWWMGARKRIPYLISEQSSEYLDGTWTSKSALFHGLNRFLFKRAKAVTAVSAWLGDRLVELGLCRSYTVVPNVIPGLDRPLPAPGPAGHFLVVADLVDRTKNVSGVLRALAEAAKQDTRLRLSVIGDGADRAMLEAKVTELALQDRVTFLGRLPNAEVLDHVARAFAMVVNSNVETFSVVTGEALAQGKPVIATRCGGPVAFITPENGILIEPRNDKALCEAMLKLMASSVEYDPQRIRTSVSERFDPNAVGNAFLHVYQRILANG